MSAKIFLDNIALVLTFIKNDRFVEIKFLNVYEFFKNKTFKTVVKTIAPNKSKSIFLEENISVHESLGDLYIKFFNSMSISAAKNSYYDVLPFGKHKGKTYIEIYKCHSSYAHWIIFKSNAEYDSPLGKFREWALWFSDNMEIDEDHQYPEDEYDWLKDEYNNFTNNKENIKTKKVKVINKDNNIITFGKHKNKHYKFVKDTDSNYCKWIINVREPSLQLQLFKDYLLQK